MKEHLNVWKRNMEAKHQERKKHWDFKKMVKKFPWKMCRRNSSLLHKRGQGLNVTPSPFFVFRFDLFSVIDSGTLMAFYWSSAAHTSTLRQKPWTNEHYYRFLTLILSNMSNWGHFEPLLCCFIRWPIAICHPFLLKAPFQPI